MATVLKKPTSRFWFAAFRDEYKRQRRISTGHVDRAKALKVAEKLEWAAKRKGNPQQVRKAFSNLYHEFYGAELPNSSVRAYCERWLKTKKPETSASTYEVYRKAITKLLSFLGADSERDLAYINKETLVRFRNGLAERFAPATVNFDLTIAKMIFRTARQEGYMLEDPAEGLKRVRNREQNGRRPFTVGELQAVLAIADPEWSSMIKFALYTGQRLGDIARLSWANVDLLRSELRFRTAKTGKTLILPIEGPLRDHIESLTAGEVPDAPLHPRALGFLQRQNHVGNLSNQFNDLLAQAGLRPPARPPRGAVRQGPRLRQIGLGFHCLRHTAVSLLKDAGVPDAVVQALVGHRSAAMSHRYTHVGRESLTKAVKALPLL